MKHRPSRQLAIVFLAVLVPAAVTLVWLALRLLEQDRALFEQRDVERQEAAVDAVARALTQVIVQAERQVLEGRPAAGAVLLRRTPVGILAQPADAVAWVARPPALRRIPLHVFSEAELLEFRGHPADALVVYRQYAASDDRRVRAGALIRTARIHRRRGAVDAAAAEYRALTAVAGVEENGMPVPLLARRALCLLFEEAGRREALGAEASALERELLSGVWALDQDIWELVAGDLPRWTGRPLATGADRLAVSAATEWLAEVDRPAPAGRMVLAHADPVTILWRADGADLAALAIPPATLGVWLDMAAAVHPAEAVTAGLLDDRGTLLAGERAAAGRVARRLPSETSLPWALVLSRGPNWVRPTNSAHASGCSPAASRRSDCYWRVAAISCGESCNASSPSPGFRPSSSPPCRTSSGHQSRRCVM